MGYWCFYLLYLVLVHQSICQTTDPTSFENLTKTIDKYAKEVLACNGSEVVSLALTVVKNGTTVLAKSYGYADYVKKIKATDETKFCIASCSKAFTTTLLAKLLDRNKSHTFDSKVKDILPDLLLGDNYTTYHVTIRDLVSHRTGMSRHDFAWVLGGLTRDTFFRHIQYMNATYGFRDQVIYNNWMYGIASRVAEALGGKPFQVLLQEEILDPLDMKRTTQIYDLKPEGKDYAKFYYVTDEGPKEVDVQLYR
ncbi:uncharacterized protein LOC106174962 [Lingula anatina]|uniref:Uncharacterized protein LOC106174962 n=1 Tax=Lingula anatina TaxID=7574 RepID=A0A1S3JPY1_LINAN|nr:uncharacterized protein LOC106174962 [Lingula anatina]|eukprot:XP_013412196.1 uncharacterized protein LOC106174962 [Lingula anatina]